MPRSKKKKFFNGDTPHGLVKRYMLKYFLQAFLPSTQRRKLPIAVMIIDGFAGAGRYSLNWPTPIEHYGSPIIALRVAIVEAANRKKIPLSFHVDLQTSCNVSMVSSGIEPYHLASSNGTKPLAISDVSTREQTRSMENINAKRVNETNVYLPPGDKQVTLVFVEANTNNYKELVKNVFQTFVRYGIMTDVAIPSTTGFVIIESVEDAFQIKCILVCAKFKQIHPPNTDGQQLFTFIDPFGYTHTPFTAVRRFIGRNKDVYINLMSSYVNRFARRNPSRIADLFGIPRPDESNDEAIDEFVNSITHYMEGGKPTNKVVNLMESYKQKMSTTGIRYQLAFEMRGKCNSIIYHLLYLSSDIYYVRQMKEALNRGAQEPSELVLSDYCIVNKDMRLNLKNIQNDEDVAKAIIEKFTGRVSINAIDMYVTLDTPYVFRKTPLIILQKRGQIDNVTNYEGKCQRRRFTFPDKYGNGRNNNWYMTLQPLK